MKDRVIGVGPHTLPWPTDDRYDPELLENGDVRNVTDKYRYWTVEAIKADLDLTRSDLHIAIENWQHDMNIGTIVRNANAFNLAGVHIIGKRHWNKRGAMVTDKYLPVFHHSTVSDFIQQMRAQDRTIVAVDNLAGSSELSTVNLPAHCVMVFGGEGPGLSEEMVEQSDTMVCIEQMGSTRSVNVGVASGIMIYAWVKANVLT